MKKKVLIIIGIIITLLVIIGIITGIEDKSRIEKMEEPKYTIKLVNGESGKITYCGLGYIIVRETAVSPFELFANSLRVKFRGWFMRYDFFRNNNNNIADSFDIIFKDKQPTDSYNNVYTILEKSETDKYNYSIYAYMGSVNIIIDGTEYSLKDALKSNKITMEKIIEKAKKDIPDAIVYRDGGTTVYHYEDYTIIKVNKVDGNRDVYIGTKDMTLNDVL